MHHRSTRPPAHHPSRPSTTTHCSDLFAIIKATEKLERAYVRDDVTAADYEGACEKLIAQFKVLWGSMRDAVSGVGRRCLGLAGATELLRFDRET